MRDRGGVHLSAAGRFDERVDGNEGKPLRRPRGEDVGGQRPARTRVAQRAKGVRAELGARCHFRELLRNTDDVREAEGGIGHRERDFRVVLAQRKDARLAQEARTGKCGKAAQVDVHIVERVMPGDVSGQHPRVRCVRVGADQRQAYARLGPHAKAAQHAHMAVAATHEDDISGDRGHGLLHGFEYGPKGTIAGVMRAAVSTKFALLAFLLMAAAPLRAQFEIRAWPAGKPAPAIATTDDEPAFP